MLYYNDKRISEAIMKLGCKAFLCGALALTLAAGMYGCSFEGQKGDAGKSAYDLAVENGFTGSLTEWLASLKGENNTFTLDEIYESAVENGFKGTYLDFLGEYLNSGIDQEPTGGTDDSAAINRALTSVTSIYCQFTETKIIYGAFGSQREEKNTYYSAGSGVFYEVDGGDAYVITNYHVVYDADSDTGIAEEILCFLYGKEYQTDQVDYSIECSFVGGSLNYDLAVLKIEDSDVLRNSDVRAATFADSNEIVVGQDAIAIGNPEAGGIAVSQGIVSVDSEYIQMTGADNVTEVEFRVIRTDAVVNEGNSGGGLFNSDGELIGIVNAKVVSDGVEGIGYALPSTLVKYVAENILDNCDGQTNTKVVKGMLGIKVYASASKVEYVAAEGRTRIVETVKVDSVTSGSLAEGSIRTGDIVVSISVNGESSPVTRVYMMVDRMLTVRSGDTVTIKILRDGEYQDVSFVFTDQYMTAIS